MKVYVAMIVEPNAHSMIGAYSSLEQAKKAQSSEGETANCIYECTVNKSNEWRHIEPEKVKF